MKAQNMLDQIKEVLGMELSKEVQLAVMKLDNGTEIEAEAFEADQQVFIKNEDGESIALPVGDYTLENGQSLKVETEGVIASIGEAEAEEEVEAAEEPKEEEAPTEEVVAEEEKEEMNYATKEELEEVKSVLEEIKEEIKSLGDHKKEMSKEEIEQIEMSAEEVEPIAHNPEALSSHKHKIYRSNNPHIDLIRKIINK
mgnify:FL=1|tara:strand:- start:5402 stop:5995 length:594 start_codon:yes stop_codon:yes gene_type:complete